MTTQRFYQANDLMRLKRHALLSLCFVPLTVSKYIFDGNHFYIAHPIINRLYPLFFFVVHIVVLYFILKPETRHFKPTQSRLNRYFDLWIKGFRFIIINAFVQIAVALIMEQVYPNLKLEFIQYQTDSIQKALFNKDEIQKQIAYITQNYYLIKLSLSLFLMIILGSLLNFIMTFVVLFQHKKNLTL